MSFPFNLYFLAFLSSFFTALGCVPLWRKWSYKTGLVDDPGHRKIHDTPIALAGGLAVMTAIVLPLVGGVAALLAASQFAHIGPKALPHDEALQGLAGFDVKTVSLLGE